MPVDKELRNYHSKYLTAKDDPPARISFRGQFNTYCGGFSVSVLEVFISRQAGSHSTTLSNPTYYIPDKRTTRLHGSSIYE